MDISEGNDDDDNDINVTNSQGELSTYYDMYQALN